jgi:23S rRNA-/tRNA-specific pseudouridylate synthase
VHLWDLRHPIVGDPVYLADMKLGTRQTLSPADPPMCLHAWRLTFEYGPDREWRRYETAQPAWAE